MIAELAFYAAFVCASAVGGLIGAAIARGVIKLTGRL